VPDVHCVAAVCCNELTQAAEVKQRALHPFIPLCNY